MDGWEEGREADGWKQGREDMHPGQVVLTANFGSHLTLLFEYLVTSDDSGAID